MNSLELYIINNPGVTMRQIILDHPSRSTAGTIQAVCYLVAKKKGRQDVRLRPQIRILSTN